LRLLFGTLIIQSRGPTTYYAGDLRRKYGFGDLIRRFYFKSAGASNLQAGAVDVKAVEVSQRTKRQRFASEELARDPLYIVGSNCLEFFDHFLG
jgi:hypothetical protein